MHEDAPMLKAARRERTGSRYSRRTRQAGGLPAVVYGHRATPVSVSLPAHEALLHIHRGEKVFQLHIEGEDAPGYVLLKDLQFDHLGTNIVHCDLERVDLNERIHANVTVHLVGQAECKGLKAAGSILMHPVNALDIECTVATLPEFIEVDIRDLELGHAIYASQVKLPNPSMKLLTDPHGVVAQVVGHAGGDASDEASSVAAASSPEVITEKKKDA